jgi:hypothetical protein
MGNNGDSKDNDDDKTGTAASKAGGCKSAVITAG